MINEDELGDPLCRLYLPSRRLALGTNGISVVSLVR